MCGANDTYTHLNNTVQKKKCNRAILSDKFLTQVANLCGAYNLFSSVRLRDPPGGASVLVEGVGQ